LSGVDKKRGEGFQMRTSALGAKNLGWYEIYGSSARSKGRAVEPVRTFFREAGRESVFLDFFADVLYGRPLARQRKKHNVLSVV